MSLMSQVPVNAALEIADILIVTAYSLALHIQALGNRYTIALDHLVDNVQSMNSLGFGLAFSEAVSEAEAIFMPVISDL